MKSYKIKVYKYGNEQYDIVILKAKDFDHLCLKAENFCRKSPQYKEWSFIGEHNEL